MVVGCVKQENAKFLSLTLFHQFSLQCVGDARTAAYMQSSYNAPTRRQVGLNIYCLGQMKYVQLNNIHRILYAEVKLNINKF